MTVVIYKIITDKDLLNNWSQFMGLLNQPVY